NVKVEIKSDGAQTDYVAIEHGTFPASSETKVEVTSVAVKNDTENIVTKEEVTENLVPAYPIKQEIQDINIKHLLPVIDVLVPVIKTIIKDVKAEIKSQRKDETGLVANEHSTFRDPDEIKLEISSNVMKKENESVGFKEEITQNLVPAFPGKEKSRH
ncbi:hypothetical protein L9F63_026824, partial [Diploptera punctata]